MRFSKKFLIGMAITFYLFVIAVFVFIVLGKTIPDSLIYSFFGLFTGELGVLGWIKRKDE